MASKVGCFFSFDWITVNCKFKGPNTELMPSEEDKLAVIVSHVNYIGDNTIIVS